jgi:hypothetical protein
MPRLPREWPDPPLVLRHSSKRIFGTWQDDYDVMSGDRIVGRTFKSTNAPQDRPWMWVITGELIVLALASNGFAPTLQEAKTAFAEHWRKWLALKHCD